MKPTLPNVARRIHGHQHVNCMIMEIVVWSSLRVNMLPPTCPSRVQSTPLRVQIIVPARNWHINLIQMREVLQLLPDNHMAKLLMSSDPGIPLA
jgi:hypothetical protein